MITWPVCRKLIACMYYQFTNFRVSEIIPEMMGEDWLSCVYVHIYIYTYIYTACTPCEQQASWQMRLHPPKYGTIQYIRLYKYWYGIYCIPKAFMVINPTMEILIMNYRFLLIDRLPFPNKNNMQWNFWPWHILPRVKVKYHLEPFPIALQPVLCGVRQPPICDQTLNVKGGRVKRKIIKFNCLQSVHNSRFLEWTWTEDNLVNSWNTNMVGFVRMWIIPKNMLIHGMILFGEIPTFEETSKAFGKKTNGAQLRKTWYYPQRPVYLLSKIADASGCSSPRWSASQNSTLKPVQSDLFREKLEEINTCCFSSKNVCESSVHLDVQSDILKYQPQAPV